MLKQFFILISLVVVFSSSVFSQTNNYQCNMTNIWTFSNYIEFEVLLSWTGTNNAKLAQFSAGIDFNYDDIANGGTLTGSFVSGSASALLPISQQTVSANIDPISHQFRILGAFSNTSSAYTLPMNSSISLGRFRITNSVPIPSPRQGLYSWSFVTASNKTKTKLMCYIGTSTVATEVTIPSAYNVYYSTYFTYGELKSTMINPSICLGSSTNLFVNFYGTEGPYTYPFAIVLYNGSTYDTIYNYTSNMLIPVSPSVTTTYTISQFSSCCPYWGQLIDAVLIPLRSVTVTVLQPPTLSSTMDSLSICLGDSVVLNASGAANYSWSGGVTNNVAFTPAATSTYTVTGTGSNGCSSTSTVSVSVHNCLGVKLILQGYYLNAGSMTTVLQNQMIGTSTTYVDTVEIELHDNAWPYGLVHACSTIVNITGNAICYFPNSMVGGNYYIVVKHRNSIETWSSQAVNFQPNTSYDFSVSANKAYGNNQKEVESGVWAIYSGELNHDENIDLLDLSILDNDINNFQFGYFASDINGDGNVDLLDSPIMENNILGFIFSNHP